MSDLIYIKHPGEQYNISQSIIMATIESPEGLMEKAFLYNVGNAVFRYHQLSKSLGITPELHEMWLEGLEEPMKSNLTKMGFEENKRDFSFTRFVNEMSDVGMDEFIMNLLNEEDGKLYQEIKSS